MLFLNLFSCQHAFKHDAFLWVMPFRPAQRERDRTLTLERIQTLFHEAATAFSEHPERSHRYVEMARKLAMRMNVSLPSSLKRHFCPHCYRYLLPGENCRVRTRQHMLVVYCLSCRKYAKLPLRGRAISKKKIT